MVFPASRSSSLLDRLSSKYVSEAQRQAVDDSRLWSTRRGDNRARGSGRSCRCLEQLAQIWANRPTGCEGHLPPPGRRLRGQRRARLPRHLRPRGPRLPRPRLLHYPDMEFPPEQPHPPQEPADPQAAAPDAARPGADRGRQPHSLPPRRRPPHDGAAVPPATHPRARRGAARADRPRRGGPGDPPPRGGGPAFTGHVNAPQGGRHQRVTAWLTSTTRSLDTAFAAHALDEVDCDWYTIDARGTVSAGPENLALVADGTRPRRAGLRHGHEPARAARARSRARSPRHPVVAGCAAAAPSMQLVALAVDKGYDGIDIDWELVPASAARRLQPLHGRPGDGAARPPSPALDGRLRQDLEPGR